LPGESTTWRRWKTCSRGGSRNHEAQCADLAAGIRRVKGVKKLGVRLGNWLTAEQGQALWQAPDRERLKGKRDRALLALLLACGLRRHEAVALTLDHLQQREEHWAIVDLMGKGGHVRTVPVPDWVKSELEVWLAAAGIDRGRLFRRVNKVGRTWGDGMTAKAVWHIVKESAKCIGVPKLAPHDLRRTCARLCHASGGELEQIQFLLGHVSVQTTERYLGCKQRIRSAVNDRIGLEPNPLDTGAADKAVNLVGCKSPHHQLPGRVVSISDACGGNEACSART
jgi:integrase